MENDRDGNGDNGDRAAPRLVETLPRDGANGAYPLAALRLRFDEPVRAGIGTIALLRDDGSVAREFNIRDRDQAFFVDSDVVIAPRLPLEPGCRYTLRISPGAVLDAAGNAFAGLDAAADHDFATAPALTLQVDGQVRGSLDTTADRDLVQVDLQAGRAYALIVAADGPVGLADPALMLIDPRGEAWHHSDWGDATRPARITFLPTTSGRYYLDVSSMTGGVGGFVASAVPLEDDFAHDASTRGTLDPRGRATHATFEFLGDQDAFRVALRAGVMVQFELSAAGGASDASSLASMSLLGLDGAWFAGTGNRVEPGAGPLRLTWVPDESGPALLLVGSSASPGDYRVRMTTVQDTVAADPVAATWLDADAAPLTGHIETPGDADLYRVELRAGIPYELELRSDRVVRLAEPSLQLFGPGFTPIAADEAPRWRDAAYLAFTPTTSGTHYLRASGAASDIGSYAIDVREDLRAPVPWFVGPGRDATVHRQFPFTFAFDEDIVPGTGAVVLRDAAGVELGRSAASDTAHVRFSGSKLHIDIGAELPPQGTYYIEIEPGAVRDRSGNAFAGWTGDAMFRFRTPADDFDGSVGAAQGRLAADGVATPGLFEVGGDRDAFAIELQAGVRYAFRLLANDPGCQASLILFDPQQLGVISNEPDDNDAGFTWTAAVSGTHVLVASGTGVQDVVGYTLEAMRLDSAPAIELIGLGG